MILVEYPKCSTCRKAEKWLEANGVLHINRDIKEEHPLKEELQEWQERSGLPLKKFFNTSGKLYKEKNLKELLPTMSEEEQFQLLASDGMLVKRPIFVSKDCVLVGFKEEEWKDKLLK